MLYYENDAPVRSAHAFCCSNTVFRLDASTSFRPLRWPSEKTPTCGWPMLEARSPGFLRCKADGLSDRLLCAHIFEAQHQA